VPHPPQRALDAVGTLARLGLAAVWLVSGSLKISDSGQTFIAVRAYDVLPDGLVRPVATALPVLELALGVFLLVGLGTRIVSVVSVLLLLVLIAAIAQSWARGLSIDCGCFGGGGHVAAGQTQYPQEIARDTGFGLLAVWLIARPWTWLSLDGWLRGSPVADDGTDDLDVMEGN
jgi:uncharacterized membrane protein YphA (DoxX/SURF4 family)